MALHDPDSTAKEKAIALKIGRQKKIQIIDGTNRNKYYSNVIMVYFVYPPPAVLRVNLYI